MLSSPACIQESLSFIPNLQKGLKLSLCATEPRAERLLNDFPVETET